MACNGTETDGQSVCVLWVKVAGNKSPQLIQLIYSSEVIEWSFFHLEFPESVHLQDCVFVRRNGTEGNGRKIYMDSGF